ncbi:MAG: branched-chain amino acid ABC transporter permease [Deltaproteobacteria bacterium]|nr:branched-chain amino acid ABC transporter permease [Deltaproteobacteria bacterium]
METTQMEDNKNWFKRGWWLILLIAAGLVAPHVISEFYLLILGEALVMSLFALSFNLLFGYMGQLPFGQAAFYGLGGYGMAILLTKFQVNFWLSFIAGIGIAALIGLLVGLFCVRLRGIYFSILTLAFGQLIFVVIYKWHDFTGGDDGIQGVFPPEFFKDPIAYYYFILIVFCLSAFILWRIIHSPFGYTLQAMRENSERTEFLGIPIARYQLIAFVISAAFAGLAGALWAPFYRSVAPSTLMWVKSGEPVMATILGGAGLFFGPVLGTFLITFIHAYLLGFTHFWPIIMGTLILIVIFLLPGGILGFIKEKLENRQNRNQQTQG